TMNKCFTTAEQRLGLVLKGVYRGNQELSGRAGFVQLHEFDSEQIPDLTKDVYIQDIHCVGSLCKLYFRELPNPLLTYQLYEKFSDAVSAATDEERLVKIHDVIQQLPPPHYRTLEFLMRHLAHLADYCSITNMHTKNLAIVWAPNLLRSKQIESACFSGTAAFMEVRIQSVVVEFILNHVDVLFSSKLSSVIREGAGISSSRPKSLLVSSPSTKLLTLEEAQARTQAQINSPIVADSKYIEVGEGPAALQGKFHTVIDFPSERKRPPNKMKKSPVGSWRSFFNLGKSSSVSKRKLQRNPSEPSEMKAIALAGEDALCSWQTSRGDSKQSVLCESKLFRPRRPRSSSDALSASFNGDLLGNVNRCNSYDNLPHNNDSDGDEGLIHVPALMSPRSAEDVDLSPPEIGVASLDFDPMSFQCSPPQAESECLDSSTSLLESVEFNKEKQNSGKKDVESGSQSQTPGSATSSEPVSPFQEKMMSPFFTMDLSPTEEKTSKPPSFSEKVAHAFSPKMGRKTVKSPPMNISEPVSFTLPSHVSEVIGGGVPVSTGNTALLHWNKGNGNCEATNRSPSQLIVLPLKASEVGASESGCQQEFQSQAIAREAESHEEAEHPLVSSQSKAVPSGQTQPGAVALDSPQDPVPVNSVSVVPPPPPPKNAARMLALALAESAQQASVQSQKKQGDVHSDSINYVEVESGITVDRLHFCPGTVPEKLHVYTGMTDNQLNFQTGPSGEHHASGISVDQDLQGSSMPEDGKCLHTGTPGNWDHSHLPAGMPGDLHSGTNINWDHHHFHTGAPGDGDHRLSHPGVPEDQDHTHPYSCVSFDQEPPATEVPVDKPHLRACISLDKHHISTEKLHFPLCTAEEKLYLLPATAGEKTTSATIAYMTTIQTTAAETGHGAVSQNTVAEPATTQAEVTAAAVQRIVMANHIALAQRQGDHQPAMGQVPAVATKASSGSNKVSGTHVREAPTPEKPPEPRVAEPAPSFAADGSATIRCTSATPVLHQSPLEKPQENARAPPLHLRSESVPTHPSYGFTPPVPPVRTLESKIAAAMHSSNNTDAVNTSNYHSFLASSMLPSSMEEALPPPPPPKHTSLQSSYLSHSKPEPTPKPPMPENYLHHKPTSIHQYRPETIPPHLSYHSKSEQHPGYLSRSETPTSVGPRYNTYASQGKSTTTHHSKPRSRVEYVSSMSPTMRSTGYTEEAPSYPTIRRVQSLHVSAPTAIRSVPISRTEVPPDNEPVFCPKPLYQYKPYQPHSDYHVTQLQPYFENGRVHYRYSPYSSSSGGSPCYAAVDGGFCDLDSYSTMRLKQFHPLSSRDFASYTSRLQSKTLYRYPGLAAYPRGGLISHLAGKEHSFISRDVPPTPDVKHMYMSWDLEDMEKYRMQSIRRESRARQKVKGPVMSQYDNVGPHLQDDLGALDVIHLRSKSDPGKTGLLTVAEGKYPAKAAAPEGEERYYMPHPEPDMDRVHYHGSYGNGQSEKPSFPQKQSSLRNRKLHETGCNPNEHRTHLPQEASHRQPPEPKNGPPYPEYWPKGLQEPSEPVGYQQSGGKYVPSGQDALRLNHKEIRLAEDRPDLERPRARQPAPVEKHSRDCYKEDEHHAQPVAPPPKPERSHSLRLQHPESIERDPGLLYPYQTLGKRQSTMTVVSQYDNLEDYHTLPQHQRGGYVGGGGFATALGQGAFLPSELCLQRPETEIHAE
uniref:Rho GTPase activating protein 32 n=1 Tax=Sphenodon punctatus TaxID=8508 RepID=A0A8D0G213_SPHPU